MAQAFTLVPLQSIVVSELPKFRGKPPDSVHLPKNKQTKFINGNTEKSDLGKFDTLSSDCVKVASLMGIAAQGFKPSDKRRHGCGLRSKRRRGAPEYEPGRTDVGT